MNESALRYLNGVKNSNNLVIIEYFYTRLVVALIDYLIELNPDISALDIAYLFSQDLARDNLKRYTGLDLDTPSHSVRLAATYYGLCGVLSSYLYDIKKNEGLLAKIPYYSYFFPTSQTNMEQALKNFKNNELVTLYSELQKEVGPVNIKSARSIK